MEDSIVIEDGIVNLIQKTVVKTIPITEFNRIISESCPVESPMLPKGCIFFSKREDETKIFIEEKPQKRQISFRSTTGLLNYTISTPWVIYKINMCKYAVQDLHIFFSTERCFDMSHNLKSSCLPNVYQSGKVCTGPLVFSSGNSILLKCEEVISKFWDSEFNRDILSSHHTMPVIPEMEESNAWTDNEQWFPAWQAFKGDATTLQWPSISTLEAEAEWDED